MLKCGMGRYLRAKQRRNFARPVLHTPPSSTRPVVHPTIAGKSLHNADDDRNIRHAALRIEKYSLFLAIFAVIFTPQSLFASGAKSLSELQRVVSPSGLILYDRDIARSIISGGVGCVFAGWSVEWTHRRESGACDTQREDATVTQQLGNPKREWRRNDQQWRIYQEWRKRELGSLSGGWGQPR